MDLSLHSSLKPETMHVIGFKLNSPSLGKDKTTMISCRASKVSTREGTNFYKVLSLDSKNACPDAIKRAYRSMALQYHPDVCGPSEKEKHTKMFIELQKAYETLSDPVLRRKYDCEIGLDPFGDGEVASSSTTQQQQCWSRFSRVVWEDQLVGLRRRSLERELMRKKKGNL
ncbi:hypothetical protein QJS10_CPB18g01243 [Acorus calamus]|uniref:J domain-containing protein n=1 Tax=Acorus calamus TaxID=4465 RepID=A0AAV9CK12_ACOCL|nr:hypothetical protein QJS10_CPB18g01243 [Acorus calamus]